MHELWRWYWRERRGVLLFPRLIGRSRLVLDIPLILSTCYVVYRWFDTLHRSEQRFILSEFRNPFIAAALLLVLAHEIGVRYVRDRLICVPSAVGRIGLLIPGRAVALYAQQRGADRAVRILRAVRYAALTSGMIGLISSSLMRIHG